MVTLVTKARISIQHLVTTFFLIAVDRGLSGFKMLNAAMRDLRRTGYESSIKIKSELFSDFTSLSFGNQ
jgi:hypothetical protein